MAKNSTNLIINYLPQSLTDDEFRSMFLSIGPLKASKIIRDRATNYSYGFGFVDYMNEDDAAKAIATLNGLQLQNKKIKVAYSRNGDKVKGANLYIKGLPQEMTQEGLQELFLRFGTIIQARVIYDQTTGQSKGVGFVLFDTRDQAESAMAEFDGCTPEGCTQPLTVKFAEDNAGKARPPGMLPQGLAAIPTRGGYNARGYTRGSGGGSGGFAGPMRRGGGMNRYNPMGGGGGGGGYGGQVAAAVAAEAYNTYGYDETYAAMPGGAMPQNGSGDGGFVLFVYNIGPDADESAMWQLFSPFGAIIKVNVIRDFQKNVGKGYCFVTMSSYAEGMNAIQQLNGYKYYGKPLQVSFKSSKN